MIVQISIVRNGKLFSGMQELPEDKILALENDRSLRTAVAMFYCEDLLADKIGEALVNGY